MANRFWVGGTGNWSDDTNHWATTTGGLPGAGNKPAASDTAIFDALSNTTAYTVTIDAAAVCLDLNFSAAPAVSGTITWAGSSGMTVSGSMTLLSGMTRTFSGTLTFDSTSTGKTITLNGVTTASSVSFTGSGGGWTVQDAWNNGSSQIQLTRGTFDTNGKTITCGNFASNNSNTRTITLGASTLNVSGSWNLATSTNLTFNANTSTINFSANSTFSGGAKTYNVVSMTAAGNPTIDQSNTFATLTRTGTAVKTDGFFMVAGTTQTITGTLTITGNSAANRVYTRSNTLGSIATLNAAVVSLTNVDFRDITAAGAASPFTGTSLGNALGNTNITTTTPVTRYWVGNAGSWSSTSKWAATSGGASGASVPICHDTAIFDANSISSGSQTITMDEPRPAGSIDFSLVTNNPTFAPNLAFSLYGSLILKTGMAVSSGNVFTMENRSAANLDSDGVSISWGLTIAAFGSSVTLLDNWTMTGTAAFTLSNGTFDANGFNTQAGSASISGSNTRTMTMGSGTFTLTSTGTVWAATTTTNLTFNGNTSTIDINNATASAKTFDGGGLTYYNLTFEGAGSGGLTIIGSNTFNILKVDSTGLAKTLTLTASTTQTILTNLDATGSSGKVITINSTTATNATFTKSSGTVTCDWLALSDNTAAGGATWISGANSTKSDAPGWDVVATAVKDMIMSGIIPFAR